MFTLFEIEPGTFAARSLDDERIFLSKKEDKEKLATLPINKTPEECSDEELEGLYRGWESIVDSGDLLSERYAVDPIR